VTIGTDGLEAFRERHSFGEWRDTRPAEELLIWRFFFGGGELAGLHALRIETVEGWGGLPSVRSLWGPDEGEAPAEPRFRIDAYEAASRVDAREALLGLLAEFQSPLIERRTGGPGDVSFGMPRGRSVVFARANIVVAVLNAGDEVESVEPVADEVDRLFTAVPADARGTVRPEIRRAEVADKAPAVGEPAALALDAEDPLGRPVWFRLSAASGDFTARDERVYYTAAAEGRQTIRVAAVNENLGVAVQTLEFEV
jgi:hypothetical protein